MSTAASANRPYRHGVLIGNWSEDEFGQQLTKTPAPDNSHQFHSIARLSYRGATMEALNEVQDGRRQPPGPNRTGVDRDTMFGHKGQPHSSQFYLSTYAASWNQTKDDIPADPSLLGTRRAAVERARDNFVPRSLDYATTNTVYGAAGTTQSSLPPEDSFVPRVPVPKTRLGKKTAPSSAMTANAMSSTIQQQPQYQQQQSGSADVGNADGILAAGGHGGSTLIEGSLPSDASVMAGEYAVRAAASVPVQESEWATVNQTYGAVPGECRRSVHARYLDVKPSEHLSRPDARTARSEALAGMTQPVKSGCTVRKW